MDATLIVIDSDAELARLRCSLHFDRNCGGRNLRLARVAFGGEVHEL
jgi:hypothetical protein